MKFNRLRTGKPRFLAACIVVILLACSDPVPGQSSENLEDLFHQIFGASPTSRQLSSTLPYSLSIDEVDHGKIQVTTVDLRVPNKIESQPLVGLLSQLRVSPELLAQISSGPSHIPLDRLKSLGFSVVWFEDKRWMHILTPEYLKKAQTVSLKNVPFYGKRVGVAPASLRLNWDFNQQFNHAGLVPKTTIRYYPAMTLNHWALSGRLSHQVQDSEFDLQQILVSRLWPDEQFKISFGDLNYPIIGTQSFRPVTGIGIIKGYPQKIFQDDRRQFGQQVVLPEESTVSIWVNGRMVYEQIFQPGTYQLTDLPMPSGYNFVRLKVTPASSPPQDHLISIVNDQRLVMPGRFQYSVNVGYKGLSQDFSSALSSDGLIGLGNFQYGMSPDWTLGSYIERSKNRSEGGFESRFGSRLGIATSRFTGYWTDRLTAWQLGFQFDSFSFDTAFPLARAGFGGRQYSSSYGALLGDVQSFFKRHDLFVATQWVFDKTFFASCDVVFSDFYPISGKSAQWSTSFTVNAALSNRVTVTGRAELYPNEPEFDRWRVKFGANWRFDAYRVNVENDVNEGTQRIRVAATPFSNVSAELEGSVDRPDANYTVRANTQWRVDPWTKVSAGYHTNFQDGLLQRGGVLNYSGSFGEVSGTYSRFGQSGSGFVQVRSSLLYANGQWGVSKPVNSNFVIVGLKDRSVYPVVPQIKNAHKSLFGTLVLTDLPAGQPYVVQVDHDNLGIGEEVEDNDFLVEPYSGYGYSIELGINRTSSVSGVLQGADGKPVTLAFGNIVSETSPKRTYNFFTNESGYFQVHSMHEGRYELEVPQADHKKVVFSVRNTEELIYDLGRITLK